MCSCMVDGNPTRPTVSNGFARVKRSVNQRSQRISGATRSAGGPPVNCLKDIDSEQATYTAISFCAWGIHDPGEMCIWLREANSINTV